MKQVSPFVEIDEIMICLINSFSMSYAILNKIIENMFISPSQQKLISLKENIGVKII